MTPELADSYRYGSTEGALISDVIDGGPAAKAQMKPEDIVVKLNGRPIRSASQLRNTIAATPPSTRVVLEVHRDGRLLSIPVVLDELSESDASQLGLEEVPVEALGLRVTRLTPDLARRLEIRDRVGVVVTSLITDGAETSITCTP